MSDNVTSSDGMGRKRFVKMVAVLGVLAVKEGRVDVSQLARERSEEPEPEHGGSE